MEKYHIWTEGCQMNVADSQRVGAALEHLGYSFTKTADEANVIVLNTCVVRQSAENKAYGRLSSLKSLKASNPQLVINLMGCLVGIRMDEKLKERFPFVDVFSPPSDPGPLVAHLTQGEAKVEEIARAAHLSSALDGDYTLPESEIGNLVSAHLPIILGCSHACTFCVIPSRRGAEYSRPVEAILSDARTMVKQGVKEVTLLGQIVDRYGIDLPQQFNLPDLLHLLHEIDGLERIRFLTSHPNYFSEELIDTIASLPKVMPHIEIPIQAGSDTILHKMRRGYTQAEYRKKIDLIRKRIPGCSIATDIIVGFPGEGDSEFQETFKLVEDLRFDSAHLARYSPRPGTVSARNMHDDVADIEKRQRFHMLEALQEKIVGEINRELLGKKMDILFEEKIKDRWKGRTATNKLVFVESSRELKGLIIPTTITWTGPWSMQGKISHSQPGK